MGKFENAVRVEYGILSRRASFCHVSLCMFYVLRTCSGWPKTFAPLEVS